MTPVRFGILGLGHIARAHIAAARQAEGAALAALGTRSPEKAAAAAAERPDVAVHLGYEALLADPAVEAVIICLPNSEHHRWTLEALAAGKHVLCEKPLAPEPEQVEELHAAAAATGLVLEEGFMYRHQPQHDWVRERILAGDIGAPTLVRAALTYTLPDWRSDARGQAGLAGGALLDAGCYPVHAARFLFGAEPRLALALRDLHPDNGVDRTFAGLLDFGGGRFAQIATGMRQVFRDEYEVVGEIGSIVVPHAFPGGHAGGLVLLRRGQAEERRAFPGPHQHVLQLAHFARRVRLGVPAVVSAADSLGNARALRALWRAAKQGTTVAVD